jgi:uncharacterized protein RhaS with RHS repeats
LRQAGIYYYCARYYGPGKGRFVERDPLEYLDGMNDYAYVHSNPINLSGPSGLLKESTIAELERWLKDKGITLTEDQRRPSFLAGCLTVRMGALPKSSTTPAATC